MKVCSFVNKDYSLTMVMIMGKRENVRGTTQYSYGMYTQKERAFSSEGKEGGKYEQDLAASMELLEHIIILTANFARLSIILYFGFHT